MEKQLCRVQNKMSGTNPIDLHVGWKIYQRRLKMGYTQTRLAEAIGVSFQQIHKYESALSRVSAARLWEISEVLQTDVQHFFSGIEERSSAVR